MEYTPVRIATLRGDQKIGFDIYLKMGERYILYIRKGDSFEGNRISRLREKKVSKMYIAQDSETAYRDYVTKNIEMAYDQKSGGTIENRSQIVHGLQQSAAEGVFENPTDKSTYNEAKNGCNRFVEFLMKEDQAIKNLLALENTDQNLAHHGVTVATYAMAIAKATGLDNPASLNFLSLGSMLHDLGHHHSSLNPARPLSSLTTEELEQYKQHATEGARMVKDLPHLDQHVVQIILQHEETIDGNGFPNKLDEQKMNPLAVIVSTANAIDRMISYDKIPARDAAKVFLQKRVGRHPLRYIQAVQALLQAP